MKRLFVHIGSPKTGTSAVQHFLLRNREALVTQGVLYPESGFHTSAHHRIGAAVHPGRVARLKKGESADAVLAEALRGIDEEVQRLNPHTVVLSTEYLWGLIPAEDVRRLLGHFEGWELHVVAYVRRQDLMAQSLYVQGVKRGESRPFNEWLATAVSSGKAGFHMDQVLACWRDCGLPVKVDARVYERSRLQGDVCRDFVQLVCPEALPAVKFMEGQVNTSPDMLTVELLRLVSSSLPDTPVLDEVRKRIVRHAPPRELFAPLSYLPASEVPAFLERFAEGNARIAREYLGAEDGVLFRDALPKPDGQAAELPSAEDLLQRLVGLLPAIADPEAAVQQAKARARKRKQAAAEAAAAAAAQSGESAEGGQPAADAQGTAPAAAA